MSLLSSRLIFDQTGRLQPPWRIGLFLAAVVLFLAMLSLVAPQTGAVSVAGVAMLALAALGVFGLAALLARFVDRRPVAALGVSLHSRVPTEVWQGLAAGLFLMSFVFVVELTAGWVELDASPFLAGERLAFAAGSMAALLPAAALEELLFRGYALQVLIQWLGAVPAVLLSCILFGVAHNANPEADWLSLANTTLAGAVLAVAYVRTRSLWLPVALHFSWNVCQGILFGLPVSGLELDSSLLDARLTAAGQRLAWLSGGGYGPEGGVVLTAGVLALLAVLGRSPRVRPAPQASALWIEPSLEAPLEPATLQGVNGEG